MTTLGSKFSYPNEVDEVVRSFVEICIDHFKTVNLGVLLIGSASRGELAWCYNQEKLSIYSDDQLNIELLQKNIEKFGTIFNTVKSSCTVSGEIEQFAEANR